MSTVTHTKCDACNLPIDGPYLRVELRGVAVREAADLHPQCAVEAVGRMVGAVESGKGGRR